MKKRTSNRLRNRSPEHFVDLEIFERTRRQIKRQERQRQAAAATTTTTTTTTPPPPPPASSKKQKRKIPSKRTKGKRSITSTKSPASGSKSSKASSEQEAKEQTKQPACTMSDPKYRRKRSINTSTLLKDDVNNTENITSPECDLAGEEDSRECETINANESQSGASEEQNLSKIIATKKRSRVELEEPEDIGASSSASSSTAKQLSSQEPGNAYNVADDNEGRPSAKRTKTKKKYAVSTEHDDLSVCVPKTDEVKSKNPPVEKLDQQDQQDEVDEVDERVEQKGPQKKQ